MSILNSRVDKEEREIYEARLKWLRDEAAALERAEEKGIEIGREEMRQRLRDIAKKQLKRGVSIDIIMEDTGLSQKEVEALKSL